MSAPRSDQSRLNRLLWRHAEAYPHRPRWQRILLLAVWIGLAIAAALWMLNFDCPICS